MAPWSVQDKRNPNTKGPPFNSTVERGGKTYWKAQRRERQAMFVSALYCIAGAYALMWALIILTGSAPVRRSPKVARAGTRTPR